MSDIEDIAEEQRRDFALEELNRKIKELTQNCSEDNLADMFNWTFNCLPDEMILANLMDMPYEKKVRFVNEFGG